MNPDSPRARLAGWTQALCATLLVPALVAGAAGPKAGEKRICVPSVDGKSWDCGTPDNPPTERGLTPPVEAGPGAEPPLFLAAPPSDSNRGYEAPEAAPAPPPSLPDEFPTVQREVAAAPTPEPVPEPEPEPVPAAPMPVAAETAPVEAAAQAAAAQQPAPTVPPVDGAEAAQPPTFLAAPTQRRAFPLAPVAAPAETAREQAIAGAESDVAAEPDNATQAPEPVAVETAAVEPVDVDAADSGTLPDPAVMPADVAEPVDVATAAAPPPETVPAREAPVETPATPVAGMDPAPEPPMVAAVTPAPAPDIQEPVAPAAAESAVAPPAADPIATPTEALPPAVAETPVDGTPIVPGPTPMEPSPIADPAPAVADSPAPIEESPEVRLVIHQATAFLRLPATAWTVQLARGGREILASAPLRDGRQVEAPLYAVAVGNGGARQWLLLWSSFPDADAARTTLRELRMTGTPRRVGPLQAEVRSAGTQRFPGGSVDGSTGADDAYGGRLVGHDDSPTAHAGRAAVAALPSARFEALPASAWTVQLARATSSAGFDALLTRSGLSPADCHVVAIDSDGARTWLLLWSQFADADAARAAARTLRGAPGAFVRRVGPLQAEARRAR